MSGPRFEIGWYNGWSPDERRATIPVQRAAIDGGKLKKPRVCSICRFGWTRENPTRLHDENYADPRAAYHACRGCHRKLMNGSTSRSPGSSW